MPKMSKMPKINVFNLQSEIKNPKSKNPQPKYLARSLPNVKKRKQTLIISRLTGT